MKKLLIVITAVIVALSASAQTTWNVDPFHSSVNFVIKHSGISFVPGKFEKFEGAMTASKADFTDASINFSVDINSINTSVDARDKHLRSADFFEAAKYPQMKFVSTSFKKKKGNNYELKGNLTIKDVTKPVTFRVVYGGSTKDQQGNDKIGFWAFNTINRLDYNVSYDPTGLGIAKDVDIKIYLQFAKAK